MIDISGYAEPAALAECFFCEHDYRIDVIALRIKYRHFDDFDDNVCLIEGDDCDDYDDDFVPFDDDDYYRCSICHSPTVLGNCPNCDAPAT